MGKKHKGAAGGIVVATGPWRELLLVCCKCGDKLGGGFGPKRKRGFADAYRQVLRDIGRRRDVRILAVGCLGVCPRGGVAVMRGSRPGEMLVVPEGFDLAGLAAYLPPPAQLPLLPASTLPTSTLPAS